MLAALDCGQLAAAFPFYVAFDAGLVVRAAGPSALKRVPGLSPGRPLADALEVHRPRHCTDWTSILAQAGTVFVLKARGREGLALRGQVLAADGQAIFVGSPSFRSIEDIQANGLELGDFALHDPITDFLYAQRASAMAFEDTRKLARKLREKSARLNAIFELSPDGFVSFTPEGAIDHVNRAFADMTGVASGTLLGQDEPALLGALEGLGMAPGALRDLADADASIVTLELARPQHRTLKACMRSAGDGSRILYFRDATHETEVDRMKSEFLTTAAHELRTPMASILGFSELLLARRFPEVAQRDMLDTIHRQSRLMVSLINELLDLARIEARAGKDFRITVQSVAPLIRATASNLLMRGDERTVSIDIPESIPDLAVDKDKFQQALTNVLSNAYKYSPNGGDIRLEVVPAESEVGIRVTDHGIGMTPDQLARVFERFYRADASGNIPGTGLGMSLVKEITELHGGRVCVDSTFGSGTTVTLWLPRPDANAARTAA